VDVAWRLVLVDPVLPTIARGLVALLFAQSVRHKLSDRLRFEGIVADYQLAPAGGSRAIAFGAIGVESLVIVGVLLPPTAPAASVAAATLLVAYAGAIALNLARGRRDIECGCGGEGETLHPWLLARNALLVGVCAVAGASFSSRTLGLADAATIGVAVVCLALLGAAGSQLASLTASAPTDPIGESS